mmetsp:Transcript_9906/g.27640  ORF Transcript_9906/g.27640 Transcript_9906/m.27640 type:complete len:230 (-) Transcript_9906:2-691(-)
MLRPPSGPQELMLTVVLPCSSCIVVLSAPFLVFKGWRTDSMCVQLRLFLRNPLTVLPTCCLWVTSLLFLSDWSAQLFVFASYTALVMVFSLMVARKKSDITRRTSEVARAMALSRESPVSTRRGFVLSVDRLTFVLQLLSLANNMGSLGFSSLQSGIIPAIDLCTRRDIVWCQDVWNDIHLCLVWLLLVLQSALVLFLLSKSLPGDLIGLPTNISIALATSSYHWQRSF